MVEAPALPAIQDVDATLTNITVLNGDFATRFDAAGNRRDKAIRVAAEEIPPLPLETRQNIVEAAGMVLTMAPDEVEAEINKQDTEDNPIRQIIETYRTSPSLSETEIDAVVRSTLSRGVFMDLEHSRAQDSTNRLTRLQSNAGGIAVQRLVRRSLLPVRTNH